MLGIPGLINDSILAALFSLTATGLYSSYLIPILLRRTVAGDPDFSPDKSIDLGAYSPIFGWISISWCLLMVIILEFPNIYPVNGNTMNYSSVALGTVLILSTLSWEFSAKYWIKGNL
jgi:hypothetical protein